MKKETLYLLTGLLVLNATPYSCFASGNTQSKGDTNEESPDSSGSYTEPWDYKSQGFSFDLDAAYEQMVQSVMNDEPVSFADVFSEYTGFTEYRTQFEELSGSLLASGITNMDDVNLNYSFLTSSLQDDFVSIDISGQASDCYSAFHNAFGDMELSLTAFEIPASFDTSSFLAKGQSIVNSNYSSVTSSDAFQAVQNAISSKSLFSEAKNWFDTESTSDQFSLHYSDDAQALLDAKTKGATKTNETELSQRQNSLSDQSSIWKEALDEIRQQNSSTLSHVKDNSSHVEDFSTYDKVKNLWNSMLSGQQAGGPSGGSSSHH